MTTATKTPNKKAPAGPQKTVDGMNRHNIDEMKRKLDNEQRRDTSGFNDTSLREHNEKLDRMRKEISDAEKKLR